ncbi:SPOR domain-containing protein [Ramlibacter pallidus]|uniref:SPOR domain-containing protein n=1 Tax=Ramlibacter pallidus TaxID=2780087 RepID=A0ABR9S024_9BURK|nr:SPOR domain-containing protein [Ramlibacter pallidus]MBE7366828.1 SPOR domain-containing protein [Ramlibacter pallidus]
MKHKQHGNVIVGIIIGIVLGLAAALAVAVYVTKVPVPFLQKGPSRSAEQDAAESRKNQNWDPNAPLYGKNPAKPLPPAPGVAPPPNPNATAKAPPAAGAEKPPEAPAVTGRPAPADPLGDLAAARGSAGGDPFLYFVQAGAFRTADDAEAQRAKLSLMGIEARVTEREQAGRQVYRVRVGPFTNKDEADRHKDKLDAGGFETALVRVQR